MIRELWARIGRRKVKPGVYPDENNPEHSVVPLRNRRPDDVSDSPETAIVTKKDHVERFTDAVHQMVEKLEGIRTHLDKQVGQNEQLLEQMAKLPDLLNTLPQSVGRQEEALRALLGRLEEKDRQDRQILDTLSSLPDQAIRQTQTLEEIHQQMAESLQSDSQLNQQVGRVCETLTKLGQDTVSQTEWLEHVCRTFTMTDRYLKLTLAKQQKRFLWMMAIGMGICLLSVLGLVAGILLMHRG
jgi:regulator of replication initiation timing